MNIYCGANERVPRGRIRGRPNQCFLLGRRTGFYAGLLRGQQQARQIQPAVQPVIPTGQSLSIGELRGLLNRHLRANPTLPTSYLSTSGRYSGQYVSQAYLTKTDYINILRQYNLVR